MNWTGEHRFLLLMPNTGWPKSTLRLRRMPLAMIWSGVCFFLGMF
jgi:hypothetical protein